MLALFSAIGGVVELGKPTVSDSDEEEWQGYIGFSDDGVMMSLWSINRLWKLAATLPVENVALTSLEAILAEKLTMTKHEMASEAKRIMDANLEYPIIFSAQGWLMDGSHRIMKAQALGLEEIKAVRFPENPQPDHYKPIRELPLAQSETPASR